MPVEHKVALVTGGARRIGRAISEDLAGHGFAVVILCKDSSEEGEAFAAGIRAKGGKAAAVHADLTNTDETIMAMSDAAMPFGPVDLLVNNASVFENDEAADFDVSTWDRHFAVHAKAPALLAREMAAALPVAREGLVVNIIDQRVWRLNPRYFSYTLSKSTLWALTQTMAQAFAPRIRVNAIGPGPTLKNVRQQDADFQAQVDALLLKRGPDLAEFGATVRYLWETRSVTGQMIALDGGQHLAWETPDATQAE